MINFRRHQKSDISFRVAWLNDPKINKFVGGNPGKKTNLKEQQKWFEQYQKNKDKKFFTICDDKTPIGVVGFSMIDRPNKNANVFIIIGDERYRGMGIGKIAMKFLVDYGFKKFKFHKINAGVFQDNKPAVNCYKAIGFTTEGVLKDEAFFNRKYHNQLTMAIFNKQ